MLASAIKQVNLQIVKKGKVDLLRLSFSGERERERERNGDGRAAYKRVKSAQGSSLVVLCLPPSPSSDNKHKFEACKFDKDLNRNVSTHYVDLNVRL